MRIGRGALFGAALAVMSWACTGPGPPQAVLSGGGFLFSLTGNVDEQRELFPPEAIPVRFVNNHDTDRLATEVEGDIARQRLAALVMATLDGTPMIYYGEEIGMAGSKGPGPIFDEYRREPMDWFAGGVGSDQTTWFRGARYTRPHDGVSVEEPEDDPGSLLNLYRQVYSTRRANEALTAREIALDPRSVELGPAQALVLDWTPGGARSR